MQDTYINVASPNKPINTHNIHFHRWNFPQYSFPISAQFAPR